MSSPEPEVFMPRRVRSSPLKQKSALWASTSARGGMSTFVATIQDTPLWQDWNIRLISTHSNGTALSRISRFAVGVFRFTVESACRRPTIVHEQRGIWQFCSESCTRVDIKNVPHSGRDAHAWCRLSHIFR